MKKLERLIESSLLVCALSSVLVIILIFYFIISNGWPVIMKEGPIDFILGSKWAPSFSIYGIFPMIVGTVLVTLLSLAIAMPLGIGCAVLIAEVAPLWARDLMRPAIETLAAIPSIVYGLFGLIVLVPFILHNLGGAGLSVLACGVVLAVMILPTIISVSEDAMRSVPNELREGSFAVGATKWQVITGIVVPSAMSGIVTGAVLAMGRSIGETMAVYMISGNTPIIPGSLLDSVEPLTALIALEWGYASGEHQMALFSVGVVLLIIIMSLNVVIYMANWSKRSSGRM